MPWYAQSGLLLVIAFVVGVSVEAYLFVRLRLTVGADAVRIVGFTVIGFLGVYAALVIDKPTNAAAIFGLLGVIAGFMAGKSTVPNS